MFCLGNSSFLLPFTVLREVASNKTLVYGRNPGSKNILKPCCMHELNGAVHDGGYTVYPSLMEPGSRFSQRQAEVHQNQKTYFSPILKVWKSPVILSFFTSNYNLNKLVAAPKRSSSKDHLLLFNKHKNSIVTSMVLTRKHFQVRAFSSI